MTRMVTCANDDCNKTVTWMECVELSVMDPREHLEAEFCSWQCAIEAMVVEMKTHNLT